MMCSKNTSHDARYGTLGKIRYDKNILDKIRHDKNTLDKVNYNKNTSDKMRKISPLIHICSMIAS